MTNASWRPSVQVPSFTKDPVATPSCLTRVTSLMSPVLYSRPLLQTNDLQSIFCRTMVPDESSEGAQQHLPSRTCAGSHIASQFRFPHTLIEALWCWGWLLVSPDNRGREEGAEGCPYLIPVCHIPAMLPLLHAVAAGAICFPVSPDLGLNAPLCLFSQSSGQELLLTCANSVFLSVPFLSSHPSHTCVTSSPYEIGLAT